MKYFFKGIGLGVSLNIANRLCYFAFSFNEELMAIFSVIVFCIITTTFLVSDNAGQLLLTGFSGLFFMIFGEVIIFSHFDEIYLPIYVYGMFGSMAAIIIASILTVRKIKLFKLSDKENIDMTKELKLKLIMYSVISALSFSYLILPENAAISVPVFTVLQFVLMWFTVPNRKRLVLFIPLFAISLNSFLSANTIWRDTNFFISIILYSCMFMKINFKNDSFEFITNAVTSIISPLTKLTLPFKWSLEFNTEKAPVIKRVAIALVIAIPCMFILVGVLSNADMVFSLKTEAFILKITDIISINTLLKIALGIVAGLYLFGIIFGAYTDELEEAAKESRFRGDLIIINILLVMMLFIYTLFVIIQFKYLFSGAVLPDGLTYTEYARKGFFELLALTGVNIAAILAVVKLTKKHQGKWLTFTKILCHYLCAVTVILLISSFYRMMLYTNDDGLTRLRFYVMGFLIFEAVGLIITFAYIAKPKFNICLVYITIALTYYIVLNLVPADNIIAKNQIDKYLNNQRDGLHYIFTLSADAAPAMEYLIENTNDDEIKKNALEFFERETSSDIPQRWQRYNFSVQKAIKIIK